jgi:uncharacterized protein
MHIVADTNVLLSAYLFRNSSLQWVRQAADTGALTLVFDPLTAAELKRVLAYPKFGLTHSMQESVLLRIIVNAVVISAISPVNTKLPICRDAADQKFLNLSSFAAPTYADIALVTGDQDLIVLAGQCAFPILKPIELQTRLASI